jgi:hypothetical protein
MKSTVVLLLFLFTMITLVSFNPTRATFVLISAMLACLCYALWRLDAWWFADPQKD